MAEPCICLCCPACFFLATSAAMDDKEEDEHEALLGAAGVAACFGVPGGAGFGFVVGL